MGLNWGGYQNQGAPSGSTGTEPSAFNKIGGLLGKHLKGSMTDDKGLFQGGKYGRTFGRIKDALGIAPTQAYDVGQEEADENEYFYNKWHEDNPDQDWDWDDEFFDEGNGENNLSVSSYGKKDSPFALKNKNWGQGMNWMEGYGAEDVVHNEDVLSDYDDETKNLYGGKNLTPGIDTKGRGQGWNQGNNAGSFPYSPMSIEEGQDYKTMNFNTDYSMIAGSPFGDFLGLDPNAPQGPQSYNEFLNTNPSKVDNELIENNIGSGHGWNTGGGGQNWRQGY